MENKVYVLGHKNPDTDSIAAAATYARLKNLIGETNVAAGRLGAPSTETSWVFDYWKVDMPEYVADVKLRAKHIMDENLLIVDKNNTLKEVRDKIHASDNSNAFVCCADNKATGIVTLGDLGDYCLDQIAEQDANENIDVKAILNHPVANLMRTELVTIDAGLELDKVKSTVLNHRYRCFPVIDSDEQVIGSISRHDIISAKPKQVILVDHNEKSQAVLGIDEAEVIEVIDHHRIADVQTMGPILFVVEPVGSTCTVVAKMYRTHGVTPEPAYAGLMLSAIISDTILFRSPTCTPEDVKVAEELASICGVNIQEYGMQLLGASSPITTSTATEVLNTDLKEFALGDKHLMIGQVMMTDNNKFNERKQELLDEMRKTLNNKELDFIALMCTNILEEATYLLLIGDTEIAENAFGKKVKDDEIYLPGVLSRKKQIVPQVTKALS